MMKLCSFLVLVFLAFGSCAAGGFQLDATAIRQAKKCSTYADMFDDVSLGEGGETCYNLTVNGGANSDVVGKACVFITESGGKTCIKFRFSSRNNWKFSSIKAGVSSTCGEKTKNPFLKKQALNPPSKGPISVQVCLDEFTALPGRDGEGCCNDNLCIFSWAKVAKNGQTKFAFSQRGKKDCEVKFKDDKFTRCKIKLNCKRNPTQKPSSTPSSTPSPTLSHSMVPSHSESEVPSVGVSMPPSQSESEAPTVEVSIAPTFSDSGTPSMTPEPDISISSDETESETPNETHGTSASHVCAYELFCY
ncbi:hypothetical protein NDN08_004747 [Rhodosorus marinus]|uniref:Pherophorin domain-containing protein n=1 Tax=Rhodosorus marinus TaxID=101924 RepID=A0AAV8UM57_9RHOD|nr:hypothetical protein NDN08_004747 [Rhodosorus marinus]